MLNNYICYLNNEKKKEDCVERWINRIENKKIQSQIWK